MVHSNNIVVYLIKPPCLFIHIMDICINPTQSRYFSVACNSELELIISINCVHKLPRLGTQKSYFGQNIFPYEIYHRRVVSKNLSFDFLIL